MLVSIGRRAWYLERMQPYTKPRRKIIIGLAAALFIVITASLGGFYLYRTAWTNNFDVVLPGKVYRSAQPKGSDFARWTKAHGLKTVINLRGESTSADVANETAAAKQEGLELIHVRFSAMEIPSALQLRRLITALETAPKPILIHCHAGADRTGVASVIAAMALGGRDYETAKRQLSAYYLHFDNSREHIGGLLNEYEDYCIAHNLPRAGWQQFRQWAMEAYHPHYFLVQITPPAQIQARAGQAVAVTVKVKNAAHMAIPASEGAFNLAVFLGTSENDAPSAELGPRTPLPLGDIDPGMEIQMQTTFTAPPAGQYDVHFDLIEEHVTWFARQGSPMGTAKLTVEP